MGKRPCVCEPCPSLLSCIAFHGTSRPLLEPSVFTDEFPIPWTRLHPTSITKVMTMVLPPSDSSRSAMKCLPYTVSRSRGSWLPLRGQARLATDAVSTETTRSMILSNHTFRREEDEVRHRSTGLPALPFEAPAMLHYRQSHWSS